MEAILNNKVILHIPHSSMFIPDKYRDSISLNDEELNGELIKLTDSFVDQLFDSIHFPNKIIFPISRLVCDVERFRDNDQEEMYKCGMGVIYTKTSDGKVFKKIDEQHVKEILNEYYDKHHKEFGIRVDEALNKYNSCLIIDAHSFPNLPLPHENNKEVPRPDFCLGVDEYHTPSEIVALVKDKVEKEGYTVKINNPYRGTILPLKHYGKNDKVKSIMIEVNKSIYMNENNEIDKEKFIKVKAIIEEIMLLVVNSI